MTAEQYHFYDFSRSYTAPCLHTHVCVNSRVKGPSDSWCSWFLYEWVWPPVRSSWTDAALCPWTKKTFQCFCQSQIRTRTKKKKQSINRLCYSTATPAMHLNSCNDFLGRTRSRWVRLYKLLCICFLWWVQFQAEGFLLHNPKTYIVRHIFKLFGSFVKNKKWK